MERAVALYLRLLMFVPAILLTSNALTMKLKTRTSDGATLCATDPPTVSVAFAANMAAAPPTVRCTMSCANRLGCKHFNYVSNEQQPCQLYLYKPTNFDVVPSCQNYEEPEDVGKCEVNNGGCHADANCTETIDGSVKCQCKKCYLGNGQTCSPVTPNCSFPFTYNGALHYSCVANMTGVSTPQKQFACKNVNATAVVCDCAPDYVAQQKVTKVKIPATSAAVPVMSVFGWIVIYQHIDDALNWQLPWADYKAGFGSIRNNFWFGLEKMHLLTSSQPYRLRVEVQVRSTGLWYSAEYWRFTVGDAVNDAYRLDVAGYSGDAGNALQWEGDWLGDGHFGYYKHDGMTFTTFDNDNDYDSAANCADNRGGGWWFNSCYYACLPCDHDHHEWDTIPGYHVDVSRMMIKPQ